MGTRGDFYVGRGERAEWLGSVAFDAFPDTIPRAIVHADTEVSYRHAVAAFLQDTRHANIAANGDEWPWPWASSATTDYGYCFDIAEEAPPIFPGVENGAHVWWERGGCWNNSDGDKDTLTPVVWPKMPLSKYWRDQKAANEQQRAGRP